MKPSQVVVHGMLRPDGSIQLDSRPNLPAGPIEVVLRPLSVPVPAEDDWWQQLQRARAELEAVGGPFRTSEEIEEERQGFREDS
ncbi:MAG: hypothetical protein WD847_20205 [Pirellulales bacterium]